MFFTPNNMNVYVFTIKYPYSDGEDVSVYDSMDAVMNRLEMCRLNGVDEDEKITIECQELISLGKSQERLDNIRKYYNNKNNNNNND